MFELDSAVKREALNFSVLLNVLKIASNRLEPLWDVFCQDTQRDIPLIDNRVIDRYVKFFNIDEEKLLLEYNKAEDAFSRLHKNDEIIKRGDSDYPPLLAQTEQAPLFLYIRGKKSLLYEKRTVALVGSRNASEKAKVNTKYLAEELGNNGITIVSGLAKGIDVTAHNTALNSGYNTIAVLGTNLNQYYPKENKNTQLEIEKRGLVISQFSPANKTERWFFPMRNGVMSGMSLATVIMEAGETSGALKQADYALKQKRQVYIPSEALEMSQITWPKKYVKRGAMIFYSNSDVLKKLSESNVFKSKQNQEPNQITLEDYYKSFNKQETSKTKVKDVNLSAPITIIGEN